MTKTTLRRYIHVLSFIVGTGSLALAWYVYGWQLPLILILFGWGMNMENSNRE